MKKFTALVISALALTGCVPTERVEGTAEVEHQLQAKADLYGTSIELEQALYECEQAHPIPVDHAPDHPAAAPLALCVAAVYQETTK